MFTENQKAQHRAMMEKLSVSPDTQALESLYVTFAPIIRNRAKRAAKLRGIVDDIVHEVILKMVERAKTYRSPQPVENWVTRITHNLCVDMLRRERVRASVSVSACLDVPSPAEGAERAASRREVNAAIRAEVDNLPPSKKRAVELFYFEELDLPSIKTKTGLKPGTVSNATHVAREALRKTRLSKYL